MVTNLKIWRESASLIIAAKSNFNKSSKCNYKLLCVQRSKSGYMPNTFVFPGGNVSSSDSSRKWLNFFEKYGYKLDSFKELYPTENIPPILKDEEEIGVPKCLSLRICAIRETFEECGVLICKSSKAPNSQNWASYIGGHEILQWQDKVHNDPDEFINMCLNFDIYPDVWSLKNWSNWVTPPALPVRFDTMFFFSAFPQMPEVHREPTEVEDIKWFTPEECIFENKNEKIMFPIPQYYEISRMRNFSDTAILLKYANDRSSYGCEKYFPFRVKTKEGILSILPGDDFYPSRIDKENDKLMVLDYFPVGRVENRLLTMGKYKMKVLVNNLTPKDKHLPPVRTAHEDKI